MGLGYIWNRIKAGDFSGAASGLFISDADIERGRKADADLAKLNADNLARGIITEEDYRLTQKRLEDWSTDRMMTDDKYSPWGGFKEGMADGANGMRKFAGESISALLGGFLRTIPWQVWLGLMAFAGWWVYVNFYRGKK